MNQFSRFPFRTWLFAALWLTATLTLSGKEKPSSAPDSLKSSTFNGLTFRSIGPAFTSGRISSLAVNPDDPSEYFVGVASGHIWKTVNSGVSFEPVFDQYGSYSIGALAMEPGNHNVIWAGTGENNHQRALGYGDGVYRSLDGGKSWNNMGLKESRQIGGIVIDPEDPNTVFVAAEGSVWGSGGERGLYKTVDGGKNWKRVLYISEETGVNNIVMNPEDPDILFATSEQRRRHYFTKIGGGPETALYKSTDKGETWRKITSGLPGVDMGGTGIAISPADPDRMYMIIEAAEGKGGFFRSTDRGESWEKMSDYSSSGQYFNVLVCDPVDPQRVYSLEVFSKYTEDGGKTWKNIGNDNRHVDDHALWIDPSDPRHFLIGGDGGLYETFDSGKKYLFKSNLPVTQFYRVGVDNKFPFYTVYGGTQDNNTFGGPSANMSVNGVSSEEWFTVLGGDGFWVAADPENPDIVYCEYQYGNVYRFDRKSGELLYIKPQPGVDEPGYKWNWNTPLVLSSHSSQRLYIVADRVFRSDDRGESWEAISGDITSGTDRDTWPVMGRFWSADAVAKDVSTSLWGTGVSFEESPLDENILFAGTDDGVLSVTTDGGLSWKKISAFPGIPEFTYVSDILASRFDRNTVFVSFDNHQRDDFKPYILISTDLGKTWKPSTGNLPVRGMVHTLEQDPMEPGLLFAGTETGIFFSPDAGKEWVQLRSGIPLIPVRDIALQERENDLVLATFGRGFYILDDYSPLRTIAANRTVLDTGLTVFPVADALMYLQTGGKNSQGSTFFTAPNPPFGACISYSLADVPKTLRELRKEKEKVLTEGRSPIPQPGQDQLRQEAMEESPFLMFIIRDEGGKVVRKIPMEAQKGINRVYWDLRYESTYPLSLKDNRFSITQPSRGGIAVLPGVYTVAAELIFRDSVITRSEAVQFKAEALSMHTLGQENRETLVVFQREVADVAGILTGITREINEDIQDLMKMRQTIHTSAEAGDELAQNARKAETGMRDLLYRITGPDAKASQEEIPPMKLPAEQRLGYLTESSWSSTSPVTEGQLESLEILKKQVSEYSEELSYLKALKQEVSKEMDRLGLSWTPGRIPGSLK